VLDGVRSVAVVVVTYNSAAVLEGCLGSLAEGCRGVEVTEVVVADNASTDGTVAIAEGHPGVRVVRLGRNAGYAAGINAGVAALGEPPEAVLVLNPDTRLTPGSVAVLARALGEPGRGIVVPRLVGENGRVERTLRRTPTLAAAVAEATVGGPRAGRFGEVVLEPERYERPGPADWATGAAMLLSWPALRALGPWDESFLLYSEETEFALRAADGGWSLWYEPAAVVEHAGGESGTNPWLWALLTWNRVRLYRRRNGRLAGLAYHAVMAAGQAVRALAGRPTARAALAMLLLPSRRPRSLPGG
jgi:N-acetylglucosaminyl-diphospho-decaprenol L-rhamnosyltransferase